jgi:hypothetical protein
MYKDPAVRRKKHREYQRARRRLIPEALRKYGREWQQHRRKTHPAYFQAVELKKHYAMTPAQWEDRFVAQAGRCAICGCASDKRLQVDHDHVTGRVRGLLCGDCNVGLGRFHDNVSWLRSAIVYLLPRIGGQ